MAYEVRVRKKAARGLNRLPKNVQQLLFLLVADLQADGPIQRGWPNFSSLGPGRLHCHLMYRYVACWTYRKNEIVIEVYYAGSREEAPY